MIKYPSIELYKNIIRKVKERHDFQGKDENGDVVYKHLSNYPTMKFVGTVKLHGTNAAIVKHSDGRLEFQSRERVLSLEADNANFMQTMMSVDLDFLFTSFKFNDYCAVYGEWCGGNIQKGVAINGLPKMFVIFGVKVDDKWVELPSYLYSNENNIYNILQFPTYEIEIDFNAPELSQNKLIEMTLEVEDECPVGKYFGNVGVGEGIVFTAAEDQDYKFKSKGEKHSVSKVSKLNSIDTESLQEIKEFVELAVTENRLNQGLSVMQENGWTIEPKNTGEFLRWVVTDVLKEEKDTIDNSVLDDKKLKNAIVTKARIWYLNNL